MNIISLAMKTLAPRARAFEDATKDPIAAQRKVLFESLGRNRNTEYGRRYNFSNIKSIADYQKQVPLSDCETMRPYLDRMTRGEGNILTSDRTLFFGTTSGTTNLPKFIPATGYSEMKKKELMDLWSYYITRDHPKVLDGKIMAIVSPEVEGYTPSGLPYGGESGRSYQRLPLLVRHLYLLPYKVFEIADYAARYYTILRLGLASNVTNIATLNPNSLTLLCQKIARWQDSIIEDIEKGTLAEDFNINDGIRKSLEMTLRPNAKRAAELKSILEEKGELLPKYFWPDMELIECWKGGTMNLYLKELALYFGDVPLRDIGCLSTEARSSIPMSDDGAGGVLAIETNFYEFIPKEDMGRPDKKALLAHELEKDRCYFIVVTTPGGLYRYNIDDIIRVDGFFNSTPVIEFVQKGLNATSLAGEKLYESQVNAALNRVLEGNRLFLEFFCAVAEQEKTSRYALLAEFAGNPPSQDEKKNFLHAVEKELCRENREYEFMRNAQTLKAPVLKVVKAGEFERYRAKRISEGAHEGQFKVPELVGDPDFVKNFVIAEEIRID